MRIIDADALKTAFPCGEYVRTESVRATIDSMPTIDAELVICDTHKSTDNRIFKVINLVERLLDEGEMNIEIYMHNTYAVIVTDGAIKKIHHIDFDEGRRE